MTERFYGGDDFEVVDYAFMCLTGAGIPDGLLFGYEADGEISGTYDADTDDIIGWIDAPEASPAGGWKFIDNCMMLGAFALICHRA